MSITQYRELRSYLDAHSVALVAVSKTKTVREIKALYDHGQRIFGENRARELAEKYPQLPDDIRWHMIGHLQTNKVKYIASFVDMIESIDSLKLLRMVQREAEKNQRPIDVLLQMKIAIEPSKYGFDPATISDQLREADLANFRLVRFRGVMGMASFIDDTAQIRREFRLLKQVFDTLKEKVFHDVKHFDTISMGMSGDYEIAVEEGSTMVRIGSLIFGPRE